jgi:oligoribonuclease
MSIDVFPSLLPQDLAALATGRKNRTTSGTLFPVHKQMDPLKAPLVWVDLEMTGTHPVLILLRPGLDPITDKIIEIAIVLTDASKEVRPLPQRLHLIINHPQSVMDGMNDWCLQTHGASGLTKSVLESTLSPSEAQDQVLAFLKRNVAERQGMLCGNSVHVDRMFLQLHMPRVVAYLHYRIIDVSSIKSLCERWCVNLCLLG